MSVWLVYLSASAKDYYDDLERETESYRDYAAQYLDLIEERRPTVLVCCSSTNFLDGIARFSNGLAEGEKEQRSHLVANTGIMIEKQLQPVIPGSSLRGLLRSFVEFVSHDCMRRVENETICTLRAVAAKDDLLRDFHRKVLEESSKNVCVSHLQYDQENDIWDAQPALQDGELWSGERGCLKHGAPVFCVEDRKEGTYFVHSPNLRVSFDRRYAATSLDFKPEALHINSRSGSGVSCYDGHAIVYLNDSRIAAKIERDESRTLHSSLSLNSKHCNTPFCFLQLEVLEDRAVGQSAKVECESMFGERVVTYSESIVRTAFQPVPRILKS